MAKIEKILNPLLLTIGGYLFSMGGRNFASFFLVNGKGSRKYCEH
jgi:hypothetical protein